MPSVAIINPEIPDSPQSRENVSVLNPDFDKGVEKYEGIYHIEVPKEVTSICEEVASLGGRALLVGGSVRDSVISSELPEFDLSPKDFDIEVYGISPQALHSFLVSKFGEKKITLEGKDHDVFKAHLDGIAEPLDISTPRRDSQNGRSHSDIETVPDHTMSVLEASVRRDLTVTSFSYDPLEGVLYDPFGGVENIRNRIIVATDEEAFQEDPRRVSRVMQFSSRFGFEVSESVLSICREMVRRGDIDTEPCGEITREFEKLLVKGKKPSIGLEFAREIGLVEKYWPELHALIDVPQDEKWHPEGDVWTHTLQSVDAAVEIANREHLSNEDRLTLILSTLVHDFGKPSKTEFIEGRWRAWGHEKGGVEPAEAFLSRFTFSGAIKDRVLGLVPEHLAPKQFWEQETKEGTDMRKAVNRLASRLANSGTSVSLLSFLTEADQRGRNPEGLLSGPLEREDTPELEDWQPWLAEKAVALGAAEGAPKKLLRGGAILSMYPDLSPGPWVGCVVNAVYADQMAGEVSNTETALMKGVNYFDRFSQIVGILAAAEDVPEQKIWVKLRGYEDPRIVLSEGKNLGEAV